MENCEEQDVPLVVFSAHREPILALAERPGWAVILGDTPIIKRQQIVEDFQAGKLKGLGMTIQIAQGINLTHAWTCLLVDKDWTPANNDQAVRRLLRIGQHASKINVVSFVSNHPLDIHVNELLDKKTQIIRETVG